MKKYWEFYVEDVHGKEKRIAIKAQKSPARTQLWKDMQRWLSENPFADFDVKRIGYRLANLADCDLTRYLANATVTYYRCSGHHKADMNEMKIRHWKSQLQKYNIAIPSDKDLLAVGIFNGDGAY